MTESDRGEALWASSFQAVANHIAHDFRNALNGVAVNLEVVRGRSARGAEVSAIAPFAAHAASQFEAASAAGEALLGFARPELGVVDIAVIVNRFSALLSLRGDDSFRVDDRSGGRARTPVPASVARAALAQSVLAALAAGRAVACEITVSDDIFVNVTGASVVPAPSDPELIAVALAHGVRFSSRGHTLELCLPALDSRATPHAPE